MRLAASAVVIGVALSGCATQGVSTLDYTPPVPVQVNNEKSVSRPQSAVWDELVRELSKSFFVINNIERESRIINVSFNSNAPKEYVDCGRSRRTYREGEVVQTVEYAAAESSEFKVAGKQPNPNFSTYANLRRQTSLEGRSNIYVAPDRADPNKTLISVNTRYVLTVRVRGESIAANVAGNVVRRDAIPESNNSYIFSTNKPSVTELKDDLTCAGTGRLESDILNMVK